MHIIECPQCGSRVRWFPLGNFAHWRQGKRQCPNCGVWLKLSNPLLVGGLSGSLFGAVIVSSKYWGFPNEWLRFVAMIAICWLLGPIVLKVLGRWETVPEKTEDSPKICMWSRVLAVGVCVALAAVIVTDITAASAVRKLLHTSPALEPGAATDAFDRFELYLKFSYAIGFSVFAGAALLCLIASFIRNKDRRAHRPLVSNK